MPKPPKAINKRCQCGSGKKFKNCHGKAGKGRKGIPVQAVPDEVRMAYLRHRAQEKQREAQQGLGNPIISAEMNGYRLVAVGKQLRWSKTWNTFHDFLTDSLKQDFGKDWWMAELGKPAKGRHPVLVWASQLSDLMKKYGDPAVKIKNAPMTGAAYAWYSLAYDLYCLQHNAELKQKLVNRLGNKDNFPGTRYETFVAATFLRAGFSIEFEDEDSRDSRHCEFTATSKRTGKKYSVEAKHRSSRKLKIGRRLIDALDKDAQHDRIVFIELNTAELATGERVPNFMELALKHIHRLDLQLVNGKTLPPAYIVLTNIPHAHFPEVTGVTSAAIVDGFKIDDYGFMMPYRSIREAYRAKRRHIDLFDLGASMQAHGQIPTTFDGQAPEMAFSPQPQARLLIGEKYEFDNGDGGKDLAVLEDATVLGARAACTASIASRMAYGGSLLVRFQRRSWPSIAAIQIRSSV